MGFFSSYYYWYYDRLPLQLTGNFVTSMWFLYHYFAFTRHLKTLFSPWKRVYMARSKPGLDIGEALNTWTFNLISRVIGAHVRIGTVALGLVSMLLVSLLWVFVFLLWALGAGLVPISFSLFLLHRLRYRPIPWQQLMTSNRELAGWLAQQPQFGQFLERVDLSRKTEEVLELISGGKIFLRVSPEDIRRIALSQALAVYIIFRQLLLQQWFRDWLQTQGVLLADVEEAISWKERIENETVAKLRFWDRENLSQIKSIGKDWAFGFTPLLDQYARDIRYLSSDDLAKNVRPQLIDKIEQLFSKEKKTNILLVGEPGVGKHMLAYFLAVRIVEGKTTPELADHRVMELNVDTVIASAGRQAKAIELLDAIVSETIRAGNIILVINDFDRYVSSERQETDLSSVFERAKDSSRLKLLALVTSAQFSSRIVTNRKLYTAMEVLTVAATNPDQTLRILENLASHFENSKGVLITLGALQEICSRGSGVMTHMPFPEKGVSLLDECVSLAVGRKSTLVDRQLVDGALAARTGVPVGLWDEEYKNKLKRIEEYLHQRVVGQEVAVSAVAKAIRRASVGLGSKDKTMGALLFLGTTGVGKTETAKALAELFFGSKEALVRVDLGQYAEATSLRSLIGAPAGEDESNQGGQLTEQLRQKPYCVLLFDEIEKAHPTILNALLTIFDEGYLTDARGEKISFTHTIVIATSNAAASLVKQLLIDQRQSVEQATPAVIDNLIKEHIFLPEFINRFDRVVLFSPLSRAEIRQITQIKLEALITTISKDQGISLEISDSFIDKLASAGSNEQFGGRYLERQLSELVTDVVTEAILSDNVKRGGVLKLE
jgi:ATP-dependent Clp protease ATP-binding subunit ClpC